MPQEDEDQEGIRVLIADNAELVRRGMREVLIADGRFTVVGEIDTTGDLPESARDLLPDVVFVGAAQASDDGETRRQRLSSLRQTLRAFPSAQAIFLVEDDSVEAAVEAIKAGARGVLLRGAPAGAVLDAIDDVLSGGTALDHHLIGSLVDYASRDGELARSDDLAQNVRLDSAVLSGLSPREREVLSALVQGQRNKEIAAELGVSEGTVKTHLRHIYRKLRVADRTTAVLVALRVRPEAA